MIFMLHWFLLFPFISCISFKDFTKIAVSLELISGHVTHLRNDPKGSVFEDELKELYAVILEYKKVFFVPELMELYCGYFECEDQLNCEAVRCYQIQQKIPWINKIHCSNIDKEIFQGDYKHINSEEFRRELREIIDAGRLKFKDLKDGFYFSCLKQSLLKFVCQEVYAQVEKKIKEVTGENIRYKDIMFKLETNFPFKPSITSAKEAKEIYYKLPEITFKLK